MSRAVKGGRDRAPFCLAAMLIDLLGRKGVMASVDIRHTLAPKEWFEEIWPENQATHEKYAARFAKGAANEGTLNSLYDSAMRGATMALVLDRGDDEARRWFRLAVSYALHWLEAPPVPGALQSTEVQLEINPAGMIRKVVQRLMRTQVAPVTGPPNAPRAIISVGHYGAILNTVALFGTDAEIAKVIAIPETRYRRSDEFAYPHTFTYLHALKAWCAGDRTTARDLTEQAIRENTDNKVIAPEYLAFLALQHGNAAEFRRLLGERIKTHRQMASADPKNPRLVIASSAMRLCRMARREGLVVVEEGPYLPLRFVPEWATP